MGLKGTDPMKVGPSNKRTKHFKQVIRSFNSVSCVWKKTWLDREKSKHVL